MKKRMLRKKLCAVICAATLGTSAAGFSSPIVQPHSLTVSAATADDFEFDEDGVNFVCSVEGFSEKCYRDNTQQSIGYGTKCCGGTLHEAGAHSVTESEARQRMKNAMDDEYAPHVRYLTSGLEMNQNQFNALCSMCFNTWDLRKCPLIAYLRGELTEKEAREQNAEFHITKGSSYEDGLRNRRNKESDLFFSGIDHHPDDELQCPYERPRGFPILKKNSRGEGVKWLQYLLTTYFGYDTGGIDGILGEKSEISLIDYQMNHGLTADGLLGPVSIGNLVDTVGEILHQVTAPPAVVPQMPYDLAAFDGDNYATTLFTWAACKNADWYDVRIYKAGEVNAMQTTFMVKDTSYRFPLAAGEYDLSVTSVNANGNYQISGRISFGVSSGTLTPVNSAVWNGHIYAVYDSAVWYHDSQRIAKNFGGHLATVTSAEENALIASLIAEGKQSAYLLGGSDEAQEGVWVWENGEAWEYSNWCNMQPDNSNDFEHGLEMGKSGVWNDVQLKDYTTRGIVLEIESNAPTAETVYGNNAYQIFDTPMNWTEADAFCRSIGGHLAYIESEDENKALFDFIQSGANSLYWFGGIRRGDAFVWSDNSAMQYINWHEKQPDNWEGVEEYTEIYQSDGTWNDDRNTAARGFICEFENTHCLEYPETLTLTNGEQYQLETNGRSLQFKSSDPEFLVVNQTGLVTAIGEGEALLSIIDESNNILRIKVTVTAPAARLAGDANCDGSISVSDAILLARVVAEDSTVRITQNGYNNADLDKDGSITQLDVAAILHKIAGM